MENSNGVKPFRPDLFLETAEEKELEVSSISPRECLWAAAAKYHTHTELKQKHTGLQFWRPEVCSELSAGHAPSSGSGGECVPCFFQELPVA